MSRPLLVLLLLLLLVPVTACTEQGARFDAPEATPPVVAVHEAADSFAVSGRAVHYFSTAVIHGQEPTETGMTQRSTDIVRLTGDLDGYALYHPTTVIDTVNGTLVNTGIQVFSGTVAGSAPVVLHDDSFRFEVDIETGATKGEVHLRPAEDVSGAGAGFACDLVAVGVGRTADGDNLTDYTGTCTRRRGAGQ